jgi:hypothetical protein
MGWVEKNTGIDLTVDALSNPVNKVLGPVEDAVKDVGRDIDDFVNDVIPGGWLTVAALAGAYYYGMPGFGEGGLSAAEAEFIAADAAQLANQGLSTAQVTQTLSAAGVPAGLAESAATLAGMGLPEAEIIANLGNTMSLSQVPSMSSISVTDALRGANLANQLLGGAQQTPTGVSGMPGQQAAGMSAQGVDYSNLLNLLSAQPSTTGLLGTRFAPQTDVFSLLSAQQANNLLG